MQVVITGLACLALALASIALTLWVTWQLEGGGAAVNEAGRMRMLSYRLALDAATGKRAAVPAQLRTLDATLDLLERGDPSRPLLVPWNDALRREFRAVRAEWRRLRASWTLDGTATPAADVDAFVQRIDRLVFLIEQRLSYWTELLRGFQLAMVVLAVGGALLLFHTMHRMVLEPLRRLGQGLGAIRAGDFDARVRLAVSSEFGELAEGFNAMAARLQSLYGDLEAKVRDKTASLEVKGRRLATLYEVSAFVGRAENLDELAHGFSTRVRRLMQADAIALRWCEEGQTHSILLASDGLPAPIAGHEPCPDASCHCGAPATAETATRVLRLQADSARSGRLLERRLSHAGDGARDPAAAQARHDRAAVPPRPRPGGRGPHPARHARRPSGRRHRKPARSGADREAAVSEERSLLARELHDSIAQSLAFLKIQVQLMRDALKRGDRSRRTHRAGRDRRRRARKLWRRARAAGALPHARQRRGHRSRAADRRCASSSTRAAPARHSRSRASGMPLPPTCRSRCCTSCRRRCPTCASTRARTRSALRRRRKRRTGASRCADDGCGFDRRTRTRGRDPCRPAHHGERAERIGAPGGAAHAGARHQRRGAAAVALLDAARCARDRRDSMELAA